MSDTFDVGPVLVTRDGVGGANTSVWSWVWQRPSLPETYHLIEYDSSSGVWTRGIRTVPGGWVDYHLDPESWPVVLTRDDAEAKVTALIEREPT